MPLSNCAAAAFERSVPVTDISARPPAAISGSAQLRVRSAIWHEPPATVALAFWTTSGSTSTKSAPILACGPAFCTVTVQRTGCPALGVPSRRFEASRRAVRRTSKVPVSVLSAWTGSSSGPLTVAVFVTVPGAT